MNLLSNDASQIENTLQFCNFLWVCEGGPTFILVGTLFLSLSPVQLAPLDVFIVAFCFWYFVKYIAFIALTYTLILLLFNSFYGRLYALLQ